MTQDTLTQELHVLLVEDDPDDVLLTRKALESSGVACRVDTATDAAAAFAWLANHRPDLVLLDINMPGMDGLEALADLRRRPGMEDLVVVMLTTSDRDRDVADAFERRANGYVQKPLRRHEVERMVRDVGLA